MSELSQILKIYATSVLQNFWSGPYNCEGTSLSIEAAATSLKMLRPLFLLDRFTGELPKLPKLYAQAIAPDCLIAITEKQVREFPEFDVRRMPGMEGMALPGFDAGMLQLGADPFQPFAPPR